MNMAMTLIIWLTGSSSSTRNRFVLPSSHHPKKAITLTTTVSSGGTLKESAEGGSDGIFSVPKQPDMSMYQYQPMMPRPATS